MKTNFNPRNLFPAFPFLAFYLFFGANCQAQNLSEFIHVDQFGYAINAEKVAVISNPQIGYNSSFSYNPSNQIELRNFFNNELVFSASPTIWNNGNTHPQSGDAGWWFDFSAVTTPGSYYIIDPNSNERTGRFEINENPYSQVLQASFKAFYYNRCNDSKVAPFAQANWTDTNNFSQDVETRNAYDQANISSIKDMSGGWFDAGDYNKYVTFAHDPIHQMLTSYTEHPDIYTDNWNIPESNDGIADILNEIKWELDWIKKMMNEDGSVHIKMGSVSYSDNNSAPPSANYDTRYYAPTCSSASLAAASCFAHAAIVFDGLEGLEAYSAQLRQDAELCFDYYESFIEENNYETHCDDGTVKAGDADWSIEVQNDNIAVACAYLFKLTGESKYSDHLITAGRTTEILEDNFIPISGSVLLEALLYYTATNGADTGMTYEIITSVEVAHNNDWGGYFNFDGENLYRVGAADWAYYWGSNRAVANIGNLCNTLVKYNIVPGQNSELQKKAAEITHYFHGVNPQGITYLSNMYSYGGDRCANQIYHTWFNDGTEWDDALSSTYGPAPGFLSGGPNQAYSGSLSPPANQPIQKSYLDYNNGSTDVSWEITEPAIYYQAAYLRLLANYVNTAIISSNEINTFSNTSIQVFPNPINSQFNIVGIEEGNKIQIRNIHGQILSSHIASEYYSTIDVKSMQSGILILNIYNPSGNLILSKKLIKE